MSLAEAPDDRVASRSSNPASSRGRPRSADRTTAILDAAVEVMHDVGWDGFRVQDVAHRAGAGLATIYRRWPTKEDLVAAAMRHDVDFQLDLDPDGDPRAQLTELLSHFADKLSGKGGSIISVLAAARDHGAMRAALDDVLRDSIRPGLRRLVEQLVGADDPRARTVADAMLSILFLRAGMLEEEISGDEFAAELLALADAVGRADE